MIAMLPQREYQTMTTQPFRLPEHYTCKEIHPDLVAFHNPDTKLTAFRGRMVCLLRWTAPTHGYHATKAARRTNVNAAADTLH